MGTTSRSRDAASSLTLGSSMRAVSQAIRFPACTSSSTRSAAVADTSSGVLGA
jgi:hypothetical protein